MAKLTVPCAVFYLIMFFLFFTADVFGQKTELKEHYKNVYKQFQSLNSKESLDRLKELTAKIDEQYYWSEYYSAVAYWWSDIDKDSSLYYSFKSLDHARKIPDDVEKSKEEKNRMVDLAQRYVNYSEYNQALEWLLKAEKIAYQDDRLNYQINRTISHIYINTDRYKEAQKYADNALFYAKKQNSEVSISNSYLQLTIVAKYIGDLNRAISYIDSALYHIKKRFPEEESYFVNSIQMQSQKCHCYVLKKEYEQAKNCLDLIYKNPLYLKVANPAYEHMFLELYKIIYRETGDKINAYALLDKQDSLMNLIENGEALLVHLSEKVRVYEHFSDYQKAYNTYSDYIGKRDSIRSRERKIEIDELLIKHETLKKEQQLKEQQLESEKQMELAQLRFEYEKKQAAAKTEQEREMLRIEEENKRLKIEEEFAVRRVQMEQEQILIKIAKDKEIAEKELKLAQRKQWIWGLSSAAALLFLVAGFILWRYNAKQKTAKQLALKNEKIQMLIRELHHRVKNNMQIISSLLSLQSENESTKDAFNEGINRIQAMGLIHQKLYLNEDATSINMKEYIENLTENLVATYKPVQKTIKTEKEISDISLDIDTAVPVGLILNEILTNALKYGMTNENPVLSVCFDGKKLSVKDNGIVPVSNEDLEKTNSFGMRLVKILSKQIEATLNIFQHNGTRFELELNNKTL